MISKEVKTDRDAINSARIKQLVKAVRKNNKRNIGFCDNSLIKFIKEYRISTNEKATK